MINQEQQQILSRGAVAWNEWRSRHKEVNIELSSIDLPNVDLKGMNLEGADNNGQGVGPCQVIDIAGKMS